MYRCMRGGRLTKTSDLDAESESNKVGAVLGE
jgi:hypothetical protein